MDQTCSCRLPVSDSCLIICEKLRREFTSKAKHPLPMMLVSSLVSYISLFNGTVSRIALWNQTPGKELQSLLGHSKFSSFFLGYCPPVGQMIRILQRGLGLQTHRQASLCSVLTSDWGSRGCAHAHGSGGGRVLGAFPEVTLGRIFSVHVWNMVVRVRYYHWGIGVEPSEL